MTDAPAGLVARDFYLSSAALDQIEACPASGVFRLAEKVDKVEPWLWWGIFIHRFLEYVQTKGRHEALAYIQQKFPRGLNTCRRIDTDSIPLGEVELAMAHNVYDRTAKQLFGRGQHPDPKLETYSRADLIFIDKEKLGRPHVVDYKTGEPRDPIGDAQLLGQATAYRRLRDWNGPVDVSFVAVRSTGELVWRTIELGEEQLDGFESFSKRIHLQVMNDRQQFFEHGRTPEFIKNADCEYCALKPHCPAQAVP